MPDYDNARTDLLLARGSVFAKFPNVFSLEDDIVSPSGHALGMGIEYSRGRASLVMFILKILSNFHSHGTNKISSGALSLYFCDDSVTRNKTSL